MIPKTMLAATIDHYGQQALSLRQMPMPTMQPGDVLVKIHAASLNPIDFKTMAGDLKMLLPYTMPLIIGSDFAGEIIKVGPRVHQFQVGDKVYGRVQKNRIGTFAEYIAVDPADIAIMPKNLSYETAAAVPLVGLTAYQALTDYMHVQKGDKLLVQAGSGGIGTFTLQLAKTLGVYTATTTSAKNVDLVRELGANEVIDYHQTDFTQVLQNYDYVFDTLGGDNLAKAFQILKPGGQVVSLSGLPDPEFAKDYGLNIFKRLGLYVLTTKLRRLAKQAKVRYRFLFMQPSGRQLAAITQLIEAGKIKPVIDRVVPFENSQEALDYAKSGRARGKIILKIT
ncbi:bifunctional protein: zinc-containing alcohol dehydrogenase [Agrilactobacillus composti DSM 18527 = JCM 14202]|nr:bifunctional protein: zinc-containing alcohol dehydrogenase [Agrilactobacillus composti DSM 18527 = JCM 14202]